MRALHAVLPLLAALGTALSGVQRPAEEPWDLVVPAPVVALTPAVHEGADQISCSQCHPDVVAEWSRTAHALSWLDHVYRDELAGRKRPELCHRCHIPRPLLAGGALTELVREREEELDHGVSCESCHLGPEGVMLGPRGAPTDAHATGASALMSTPGSSALCASCHDTNIGPVIGVAKDFEASKQAERGRSCVGCHMAPVAEDGAREASDTGAEPAARRRRSHELQTPRDPTFLRRAFALSLRADGGAVVVANRAGHRVPGLIGRKLRFEAQVLDAAGAVVGGGTLELDARRHLPVDGEVEIPLDVAGAEVLVRAVHEEPRAEMPVPFLEERFPFRDR